MTAPLRSPLPARVDLRAAALSCLAACLLAPAATAQPLFHAGQYLPGADGGKFRASGDFDGDGDLDLLLFAGWPDWSGMVVFFNDGTGSFDQGPTHTFTAASPGVEFAEKQPALGDFDGDGFLDVAIDHAGSQFIAGTGLEVLFGNGQGAFTSWFLPMDAGPRNLIAGQIDGDAADELLVQGIDVDYDQFFVWYDGVGQSLVPAGPPLVHSDNDLPGAFVMAGGDFDGDGDTDVVASSLDKTRVLLFPTVDGTVTFGPRWAVPAALVDTNHRLRCGDLDADGDEDVIWIGPGEGPWLQVYENTGAGLVQHPAQLVPEVPGEYFAPHTSFLGDWDGDGFLEVFSRTYTYVRVLNGQGDLTFSVGSFLPNMPDQQAGAGPGDFTGDGRLDFVGPVTLFVGDGTSFGPPATAPSVAPSVLEAPARYVDFEGDGDRDLVGDGQALTNDGTGAFSQPTSPVLPGLFESIPGESFGNPLAFDDFTGDGRADYVVPTFDFVFPPFWPPNPAEFIAMRLMVDDGLGRYVFAGNPFTEGFQLEAPPQYLGRTWPAGDVDGDGDNDLLVENGYWENDGSGNFPTFVPAYAGFARAAFDVEGDGDQDLLVMCCAASSQLLLYRAGPSGYTQEFIGAVSNGVLPWVVDLDGDGDRDLWAGAREIFGVRMWQNVDGVFSGLPATFPSYGIQLHDPPLEDVNGDGSPELLGVRYVDDGFPGGYWMAAVYERTGSGFTYERLVEYILLSDVDAFLDVDGDGDRDILSSRPLENVRIPEPEGGVVRQFGAGFPGTGDYTPLLGAQGPVASTAPEPPELRLVQALGGSLAWLLLGVAETEVPNAPWFGTTLYVDDFLLSPPIPLTGVAGEAGTGTLTLPLPTDPSLLGLSLFWQAIVYDLGSPVRFSVSNGLELTFGL